MHHRSAFTLVELSIVLVILGLLVGGVLSGQSLIRAAELRAVGTEFDRYITATNTFRDKYMGLPGDLPNAESFWGTAADCTDASTGTETCNGDGNSAINTSSVNSAVENYRYWQHLANAGLIEGTYPGIYNASNNGGGTPGVDIPASRLSGGGWYILHMGTWSDASSTADYPVGNYGNLFWYGAGFTVDPVQMPGILKTEEAYNIDTKLDDGKPHLGKIRTLLSGGQNNVTQTCTTTARDAYRLSEQAGNACQLLFLTGF